MARLAAQREAAGMRIVAHMAVLAGGSGVLERGRGVTGLAGNYGMKSQKWKLRKSVIEHHIL